MMAISDFFVEYWWLIFGGIGGGLYAFFYAWKRNKKMQAIMDRLLLKLPIFGELIRKATIARWTRTLATMFAAGVPLVESLDSVAGAAGNAVYFSATKAIQREVSTGSGLTAAMQNTEVFPSMGKWRQSAKKLAHLIRCWVKWPTFMKPKWMTQWQPFPA
jgi:type IV pilus assembly protein PilC